MPPAGIPTPIQSNAGIRRDGTVLEGNYYIDGQWCRFYKGKPRKMKGYQAVTSTIPELVRGMTSFSIAGIQYLHLGSSSKLIQVQVNPSGNFITLVDRTPAGFVPSADYVWQFAVFQDPITAQQTLIAHASQSLTDISDDTATKIYVGQVNDGAPLVDSGLDSESGGICIVAPYLFSFGSNGHIAWTAPGNILDQTSVGSNDTYITSQKIIKGLPLRNGSGGPAIILWSLDSVIRGLSSSDPNIGFTFDTLSEDSSILSDRGVIEYDGVFYWAGVDRFLMFNGVVQEAPNSMNLDWFFDNLNYSARQKVFAYKVPRRGEIWWCYPRGNATECTHAVIHNVRENTWYDTPLPDGGRADGIFAKVYNLPFMIDLVHTATGYTLWQHETGLDRVNGNAITAISSFFETNEMTLMKGNQPSNSSLSASIIEPDFNQVGDMSVIVRGRSNARAPLISSAPITFSQYSADNPALLDATEQVLGTEKTTATQRLLRFKFESNVAGGDYYMGEPQVHVQPSQGRYTT